MPQGCEAAVGGDLYQDKGPLVKAGSCRGRCPTGGGPRSPRVNLPQIPHCDRQAHKVVLLEAVLSFEFNFFFKCAVLFLMFRLESRCLMEPEGDKSVKLSSTAAHFHPRQSCLLPQSRLGSPNFQQRSLGALKLTCLNSPSKTLQP